MHLFLKLHQLAAGRGDGLRPELLELLTRVTPADAARPQAPVLTVVQPGNHPDGVAVVPSEQGIAEFGPAERKALA